MRRIITSEPCLLVCLYLLLTNVGQCMNNIEYKPSQRVGTKQNSNDIIVDSQGPVGAVVNNTINAYATTRRTQLSLSSDERTRDSTNKLALTTVGGLQIDLPAGKSTSVFSMSVKGMTSGHADKIICYVRLKTGSTSNQIDAYLRYGSSEAVEASVESTSYGYAKISLDVDRIEDKEAKTNRVLTLWLKNEGSASETIIIKSADVFEAEDASTPDYVDLSSSNAFDADKPLSPAHLSILNKNVRAINETVSHRMLYSHYWDSAEAHTISSSFSIVKRRVLRKPKNVGAITAKLRVSTNGTTDFRAQLYNPDTGAFIASSTTVTVTGTATKWIDLDLSTSSSFDNLLELRILSKSSATTVLAIHCMAVVSDAAGGTFPGLPLPGDVEPNDPVLARTLKRSALLQDFIASENKPIMLADFMSRRNPIGSGIVSRSDVSNISLPTDDTLLLGLLFPTHGARHLIAKVELEKPDPDEFREITYSSGSTMTVGDEVVISDASGARVASGYVMAFSGTTGGTVWLYRFQGQVRSGDTASGVATAMSFTCSSSDDLPSAIDGDFDLYFKVCRDTGTGGYASGSSQFPASSVTPEGEQIVDISERPYGSRWTQTFRVPIEPSLWNDHSYDGSGFPYVFTLISKSQRDGVDTPVDSVILHNASVFEEIPPYLEDGSD